MKGAGAEGVLLASLLAVSTARLSQTQRGPGSFRYQLGYERGGENKDKERRSKPYKFRCRICHWTGKCWVNNPNVDPLAMKRCAHCPYYHIALP